MTAKGGDPRFRRLRACPHWLRLLDGFDGPHRYGWKPGRTRGGIRVIIDGDYGTLSDHARRAGVPQGTILCRFEMGFRGRELLEDQNYNPQTGRTTPAAPTSAGAASGGKSASRARPR